MRKKLYIITTVLMASLLAVSHLKARVYIISNIKRAIQSYEKAIERIERQARNTKTQRAINEMLNKEKKIKETLGITNLEKQKEMLERSLDRVATTVYTSAVNQRTQRNSFADVNRIIYQIYGDKEIKIMLNKILELQRKIAERIKKPVNNIQKLGREINQQITKSQVIQQLKAAQSALLPIIPNIKRIKLSPQAVKKLNPIESELIKIHQEIEKNIARLPTASRNQIARLKNAIRRLEIILEYIRNPETVQAARESEILGI